MSRIHSFLIDAAVTAERLSPQTVYARMRELTAALESSHNVSSNWFEHSDKGPIALNDEQRFIDMLAIKAEDDLIKYPALPNVGGAEAKLTTAANRKDWEKPGLTSLIYRPWAGRLTLTVYDPIEALGDKVTGTVRGFVAAIASTLDTSFIGTDVTCPFVGKKGYDTYAHFHQLFPHRRWLGWMGFVPELVPRKFIPEAAAMEVVKGKGTIIVAVDECFDLRNPDHIRRANQVELRMANAGLLDIIDPSLLG